MRVPFHRGTVLNLFATDRYKSLKIRIVLLDAFLSLVPLFIVITITYFWFQSILKEDFRNQLRWEITNTKQSIESFVEERVSLLRFITSTYSYEQLSDQKVLSDIFLKFKREFPGIVDIGVIDSNGVQQAYAGPYRLRGINYSDQVWFNEIVIRSSYVSDVFMGFRRIPHFAIAVKKEIPGDGSFWVLRLTIDMETLRKYVAAINLRENDDAFIINEKGILQTPSRFYGAVLQKYDSYVPRPKQGVVVKDMEREGGECNVCGYASIENSPWTLVTIIGSSPYAKIPQIFRNELVFITIASVLIGVSFTFFLAQTVVNRIRKADQERERAIAESEHAGKMASIGRLAAGVAHEINNPLAIINEKAGLMKDILERTGAGEQKEKFISLINGIFESVNRCRTVTHRLLGFSRRMDISHDTMNVNDVIKEVIGFLEQEIVFRKIELKLALDENLPKISTDKGQVQQVFLNIINNAVDAVAGGGVIEISTSVRDSDRISVSVTDNGTGIPKDKIKHIFEPFYTTKERGKGTGLGLSISYGIMQRLGGTILVESQIGKGSTFTIEMPLQAPE